MIKRKNTEDQGLRCTSQRRAGEWWGRDGAIRHPTPCLWEVGVAEREREPRLCWCWQETRAKSEDQLVTQSMSPQTKRCETPRSTNRFLLLSPVEGKTTEELGWGTRKTGIELGWGGGGTNLDHSPAEINKGGAQPSIDPTLNTSPPTVSWLALFRSFTKWLSALHRGEDGRWAAMLSRWQHDGGRGQHNHGHVPTWLQIFAFASSTACDQACTNSI